MKKLGSVLEVARSVTWALGSTSPRRQEILRRLGLHFEIHPHTLDEEAAMKGVLPGNVAEVLASAKAESLFQKLPLPKPPLICADTTVLCDGTLLGQPAHEAEALDFYRLLGGREHRVVTALCVMANGVTVVRTETARVWFARFDPQLAESYLKTREWRGAAGGYRLQETGEVLVEKMEGSPSCVAGLPIRAFYEILHAIYADALVSDTPAFGREI